MAFASLIARILPTAMCLGRWLKPHVLVMMVVRAQATVGGNPFGNQRAGFDIGGLDIDRANAELLVSEQPFESVCPIMLDQVGTALDLADQVRLVASCIEIPVTNLTIIIGAYRIVSLADMNRHMNICGYTFDRQVDRLDRASHFFIARRGQVRLVDRRSPAVLDGGR